MPSAKTYGAYVNTNIMPNSRDGFFLRSTCFNNSALIKANTTPMPADAKNIRQNRFKPSMIASLVVAALLDSRTEVVNTMEMASFRIDSPKTNMLRTGSTSRA